MGSVQDAHRVGCLVPVALGGFVVVAVIEFRGRVDRKNLVFFREAPVGGVDGLAFGDDDGVVRGDAVADIRLSGELLLRDAVG